MLFDREAFRIALMTVNQKVVDCLRKFDAGEDESLLPDLEEMRDVLDLKPQSLEELGWRKAYVGRLAIANDRGQRREVVLLSPNPYDPQLIQCLEFSNWIFKVLDYDMCELYPTEGDADLRKIVSGGSSEGERVLSGTAAYEAAPVGTVTVAHNGVSYEKIADGSWQSNGTMGRNYSCNAIAPLDTIVMKWGEEEEDE